MTTHASYADGPRDIEPLQLPRLVGAPDGQEQVDDRVADLGQRPGDGGAPEPRRPALATLHDGPGALMDLLWPVVHNLTSLITAPLALTLMTLGLGGFLSLPAVGVGLLLLVPALWGSWGLSRLERHRIAALLGADIGERPVSRAPGWRQALGLDENRLRALGWCSLHGFWGLIAGCLTAVALTQGLLLSTLPLWGWGLEQIDLVGLPISHSVGGWLLLCGIGLLTLAITPWLARGLAAVDVALARWLIGADQEAELRAMSARVETLTTTRTETLDSVEAERRRIERDLHDGPQQRLVSIAMNLGLAKDALEREPTDQRSAAMVRDLLDEAHASSKEAITEMRQVARGIVPPILTDRGLDAAVSALAARHPAPVTVTSRLPQPRLDPTTEAVAYFCISEALTNVAKHARAQRVGVDLGTARGLDGELLAVTVTDDGQGGAVVGGGSGLTGLRQRVAAVDGQVHVHSPVGHGTTVAITLPLRTRGASA